MGKLLKVASDILGMSDSSLVTPESFCSNLDKYEDDGKEFGVIGDNLNFFRLMCGRVF